MRSLRHKSIVWAALILCSGIAAWGTILSSSDQESAFDSTPRVNATIRSLLQSKNYEQGIAAINQAIETKEDNADYLLFLKGRAQHLSGHYQDAIATFHMLELQEGSRWRRQAKFARAMSILKTGDIQAAEEIYESEVRFLLSTERKHEIAMIYLEFANAYYRAQVSKTGKLKKPDYQKALTFFTQALQVGIKEADKSLVEFRMARCRQQLNDYQTAIAEFFLLSTKYPQSKLNVETRFQWAMSLLAVSRQGEARTIFQNLVEDYSNGVAGQLTDEPIKPGAISQIEPKNRVALAAYMIAHTHGFTTSNSIDDMELGLTAAKRFIASFPNHELAAQAHQEIAQAYLLHNRVDDAVITLKELVAEPRYGESEILPAARLLLGNAFMRQKKFDRAIEAWKDYLGHHSSHSSWASVQQAIVNTEYIAAYSARQAKRYDDAIKLWTIFIKNHPLDQRAQQIMLEFGLMQFEQKNYDEAIEHWERLVSKYPNTEHSSRAQFLIASVYEQQLNDFPKSLSAYRSLTWGAWADRAKQRIIQLTRQELNAVTERVFRTNQSPRVTVTTRNVREVTIRAYRIDLETYFRKMHLASGIENLDIALIDPNKSFTFKVKDYTDYKQIVSSIDIPLETPGVMAVTVSVEAVPIVERSKFAHLTLSPQETTTMVIRSDIDVLVKSSRNELFVFAENMRTEKPVAGVKLLVSDGSKVFREVETGADGVFIGKSKNPEDDTWAPLRSSNDIRVFAVNGKHVASNVVGLKDVEVAQGITSRGFIYTGRPVYKPGQLVNLRGVVRWVESDNYTYEEGKPFTLTVLDPRGRVVRNETVTLNSYGSFASRLVLPERSPQGQYRIQLHDPANPGFHNYQGTFVVREFRLQPIRIAINTDRQVYYRGEEVKGTIKLSYYYGAPVVGKYVSYVLANNLTQVAKTDASGEITFSFGTRDYREDQLLSVSASYTERNIATSHNLFLATRGFSTSLETARDVYVAGETFGVTLTTTDAAKKEIGKKLDLVVVQQTDARGEVSERTIETVPVATDETTGIGHTTVKITRAGTYVLRAIGDDRFGNTISTDKTVVVSGDDDSTRLRILADSHNLRAGSEKTVTLHWRNNPALGVVTFQGAHVLKYQLLRLKTGANQFKINVHENLAPNFELVVSVMSDSGGKRAEELAENEMDVPSFHEASSPFEVERPLNVEIHLDRDRAQPGEKVTATISTTDPQGKSIAAELSLAMIDQSLLRMFAGLQTQIDDFFGGVRRSSALRTVASCTFKYSSAVDQIDDVLLAESLRKEIELMEERTNDRFVFGNSAKELTRARSQVGPATIIPNFANDLKIPIRTGSFGAARPGSFVHPDGNLSRLQREARKANSNAIVMFSDGHEQAKSGSTVGGDLAVKPIRGLERRDVSGSAPSTTISQSMTEGTGYWNPTIITDMNGKASLEITMPARSTSWELFAQGITKGTLTGSVKTTLVSEKDLFGELKLPLAYVDGDQVKIAASVHNSILSKGKIAVTLKSVVSGETTEETKVLEVTSTGIHDTEFALSIRGSGGADFELLVVAQPDDGVAIRHVLTTKVPINSAGIPVFTSSGGAATGGVTNWISPPDHMVIQNPRLQLTVGGSIQRTLLNSVLGESVEGPLMNEIKCTTWTSMLERSTSDILASIGLMRWSQKRREKDSPHMVDLSERIRASVSILVSSQNDDGGWTWGGEKGTSDTGSSARALWSLALAHQNGFRVPADTVAKATTFVQTRFAQIATNDFDNKSILLHALTQAGRGDFAYANRLHRSRQILSARALAYLAATFADMKRNEMARELLGLLGAKINSPSLKSSTQSELHAIMLQTLNKAMPNSPACETAVARLLQSRVGSRWTPDRATGPAIVALSDYYSSVQHSDDKYKLNVFVNGEQVAELVMNGSEPEKVVDVPLALLKRGEPIAGQTDPAARRQRIRFEMTGRGRFSYNALMVGSVDPAEAKNTSKNWRVNRFYEPAPLELDGRVIPRGFGVLAGQYKSWRNSVTELPRGKKALVELQLSRVSRGVPDTDLEYLVVTEPIPSGAEVLRDSISGPFDRYEITPGYLTIYVGNRRDIGSIRYQVVGVHEGQYAAGPTVVRNFYTPSQMVMSKPQPFQVLPRGVASKNEYRLSPVELYEFGKRFLTKRKFAEASKHLNELLEFTNLKPEIARNTVSMLFAINIERDRPRDVVKFFEIIKEKYPDQEIPFDQIVKVGSAYRSINEYERSYLVFRAIAEGSFMRESQVAGFLREQGELEKSVAVMDRLVREYPPEPYVAAANYAVAQEVFSMADSARTDPKLIERGITRINLISNAIERLDLFLTAWPDDPAVDQASFSLANGLVELEEWDEAIARCSAYADRYPTSDYLDSFWYIIGYGHFAKGNHDLALEMCKRVAQHTRKDKETGQTRDSLNKKRSIYIMGQVQHARGNPAAAIEQYQLVSDEFPDAREALQYFTRKSISLSEITAIKPGQPAISELSFRNVALCEIKVYRIDLMKFSLLRRSLANITEINLSGIQPLQQKAVVLGEGKDYQDRTMNLALNIKDEGAYLVVCRGDNLHTSGLVLVSPLKLDVQEDKVSGRVRTIVKNTMDNSYASDVQVKVIGSRNETFQDGKTDLRGIFVSDNIQGRSTVIARAADGQYAFHRGGIELGKGSEQSESAAEGKPARAQKELPGNPNLLDILRQSNKSIQLQQSESLQRYYKNEQRGIPAERAF